jgi:hypothetical protein
MYTLSLLMLRSIVLLLLPCCYAVSITALLSAQQIGVSLSFDLRYLFAAFALAISVSQPCSNLRNSFHC